MAETLTTRRSSESRRPAPHALTRPAHPPPLPTLFRPESTDRRAGPGSFPSPACDLAPPPPTPPPLRPAQLSRSQARTRRAQPGPWLERTPDRPAPAAEDLLSAILPHTSTGAAAAAAAAGTSSASAAASDSTGTRCRSTRPTHAPPLSRSPGPPAPLLGPRGPRGSTRPRWTCPRAAWDGKSGARELALLRWTPSCPSTHPRPTTGPHPHFLRDPRIVTSETRVGLLSWTDHGIVDPILGSWVGEKRGDGVKEGDLSRAREVKDLAAERTEPGEPALLGKALDWDVGV